MALPLQPALLQNSPKPLSADGQPSRRALTSATARPLLCSEESLLSAAPREPARGVILCFGLGSLHASIPTLLKKECWPRSLSERKQTSPTQQVRRPPGDTESQRAPWI